MTKTILFILFVISSFVMADSSQPKVRATPDAVLARIKQGLEFSLSNSFLKVRSLTSRDTMIKSHQRDGSFSVNREIFKTHMFGVKEAYMRSSRSLSDIYTSSTSNTQIFVLTVPLTLIATGTLVNMVCKVQYTFAPSVTETLDITTCDYKGATTIENVMKASIPSFEPDTRNPFLKVFEW